MGPGFAPSVTVIMADSDILVEIAMKALAYLQVDGHETWCTVAQRGCSCGASERGAAAREELWEALRKLT